jgi:hypothetical protein
MPDSLESKIWFKDSCVIYEVKVITTFTNDIDDSYFKESHDIYKYTYLDLRTLICQDYYNLSDTALPVCNYQVKSGESMNWDFYSKRSMDPAGEFIPLPDTIFENKSYKRVRFANKAFQYEDVFYLDCEPRNNIFHINKTVDELYPNCKVVRLETRGDLKSPLVGIFHPTIVREKLTTQEKEIFKKWGVNAKSTTLPMLTQSEASKKCKPPAIEPPPYDTVGYKKTKNRFKLN